MEQCIFILIDALLKVNENKSNTIQDVNMIWGEKIEGGIISVREFTYQVDGHPTDKPM